MSHANDEVYFEMIRVGAVMKVVAIDAASGTEVSLQAPAALSPETLKRAALAKLRYVLRKQTDGKG